MKERLLALLVMLVALAGCGTVERAASPPRTGGHVSAGPIAGIVEGHLEGVTTAPAPPPDGCPVVVPHPAWARAIRAAARAAAPEAPAAAACELASIIEAESGWRPAVCSPAGACGLPQLMPAAAAQVGVRDRTDPVQAIRGGMRYWDWCVDMWRAHGRTRTQKTRIGKACWNAGPARPLDIQRAHGCLQAPCMAPWLPLETYEFMWRTEHLQRTGVWSSTPPAGWLGR